MEDLNKNQPFFLCEDRRALVLGDFLISVNAYDEVVAHCFGLAQGIGMAKMNHIIAVRRTSKIKTSQIIYKIKITSLSVYRYELLYTLLT